MKRRPTYHDDLMRDLKNRKTALGYLSASLAIGDKEAFLLALRNVAEAWGGMSKLSKTANIPRISLYRMLSTKGNPQIDNLENVLKAFGFRLAIVNDQRPHLHRAA